MWGKCVSVHETHPLVFRKVARVNLNVLSGATGCDHDHGDFRIGLTKLFRLFRTHDVEGRCQRIRFSSRWRDHGG